ncbi:Uncharacterised protein [Gallibacterium anatis]|uniref:Uncharacterized protein n=1 Tax=Gallibacterium anatis TaxID=750 RepID=A0A377H6F1_9PAST|nr:hypothetical protein [Gallibacterium anatis]KGQ56596.1 hypothetical protein IE01_06520 [Gallibacterium anatis DSM 16844 = F 149]STO38145.1 Uncharacterised protein [Gallibacterium anatis]
MLDKIERKVQFFFSILMIIFVIASVPILFIHTQLGMALLSSANAFLVVIAFFEVRNLKDWENKNVSDLVKGATIAARAAYKLKQHRGLDLVINGKKVTPDSSELEV